MINREAKKHQEAHIKKLRARRSPEEHEIEGIKIIVNPDVFGPASDTKVLAKNIKVTPDQKVLDLTTGSGISAAIAAKQGAEVVAVDILPEAIKNAKENFTRLDLRVKTIQSDMFERVPRGEFDLILVNGPYFEGEITDPLEYASLDLNNFLEKLFSRLREYLKKDGKLLITFAEFGQIEVFFDKVKKYNLKLKKIDFKTSSDGKRTYNLYEIR